MCLGKYGIYAIQPNSGIIWHLVCCLLFWKKENVSTNPKCGAKIHLSKLLEGIPWTPFARETLRYCQWETFEII
jgi:hypothetical protein